MAGTLGSLRSIGAGPDGASFSGVDGDGRPVLALRIRPEAFAAPARKRHLLRSIALHEAAARERPRGLAALYVSHLARAPATLVLERTPHTLAELGPWQTAADSAVGLALLADVAWALALLHREGLAHGGLGRSGVWVRADGSAAVVTLGVQVGLPADDDGDMVVNGRDAPGTVAADAFAFGWVCAAAAIGAGPARALLGPSTSRARDDDNAQRGTDPAAVAYRAALIELARALRTEEPSWRPPLEEAARRLDALRDLARRGEPPTPTVDEQPDDVRAADDAPSRVGRFTLDTLLGSGAMGRVYRGTDSLDGTPVAVKLLAREGPITKKAIQRFRKEARLLSEISSPGVARFRAEGVEGERFFLVTEFVDGAPLAARIRDHAPLDERRAVDLVSDILRALADVHGHGIVHRDLKPDNVMLVRAANGVERIKIIDFGIARHLDETASLAMTRQGALLGTPLYMAPEQVRGGLVDQRTDLYAVGTILFELLVGRPPFAGLSVSMALAAQLDKPSPRIDELRPGITPALAATVARSLQKDPADRFPDARAMLAALAPFSSTAATSPAGGVDAVGGPGLQRWTSSWTLRAAPEALWPFVSDTDRLNRAIGLGAVDGTPTADSGGLRQTGSSSQVGIRVAWVEHPYEWLYARRLSVLREYHEGPLLMSRSVVELTPFQGGTRLVHTIELQPRGLIGRALASMEIGLRTRRALDRVYERIDELVRAGRADGVADVFEDAEPVSAGVDARFVAVERGIIDAGAPAAVVAAMGDWLRHAPAQEVARIRPIALARRLGMDVDAVIDACLQGAQKGLLVLLWDVLCPSCRVPSSMATTLQAIRDHGRCEVCHIDWGMDLSSGIELVFRIHPTLRAAEPRPYCLSSPGHTPHVVAQVRVAPGATHALSLALPPGHYRLTGRRLAWRADFVVRDGAPPSTWQVPLGAGPEAATGRLLPPDGLAFDLANDTDREQLIRIERTTPRDDVLTASAVLARPLFRRLFPLEVLAPATMLRAGDVTVLLAELRAGGSTPTLEDRYAAFRAVEAAVLQAGGVVVKLHGTDGVLATFAQPADALRAADGLPRALASAQASLGLVVGIHRGAAGAVALGDHVDYFGAAVDAVAALVRRGRAGELVVSDEIRADAGRAGLRFTPGPPLPAASTGHDTTDDGGDATLDDLVHRAVLAGA